MDKTQQLKSQLIEEATAHLKESGLSKEEIQERKERLKDESIGGLRFALKNLEDYFERFNIRKGGVTTTANSNPKTINPIIKDKKERVMSKNIKKEESATEKNQKAIAELKKLDSKELVEIGKEGLFMGISFKAVKIDPKLCKGDIFRMVAYPIQDALGLGSDKSAKEEAKLADPKNQKKSKEKAVKERAEKKAKAPASKKPPVEKDPYGFRKESKGSNMFALLIAGVGDKDLKTTGGAAVQGFIAGIKKDPSIWPAGRKAVITRAGEFQQITSFIDKKGTEGKTKPLNKDLKAAQKEIAATQKAADKEKAAKEKAKEKAAKAKLKEKENKEKAKEKASKDKK